MKSRIAYWVVGLFVLLIVHAAFNRMVNLNNDPDNSTIDISSVLSDKEVSKGFKRAVEPISFSFPQDHGTHPDYQTEWWYFTGNLKDEENNNFGYQLTFFRRALTPDQPADGSSWSANSIYFAHFAVTDVGNQNYYSFEKWSRAIPRLAGSDSSGLHVWIDDWVVKSDDNNNYVLSSNSENIEVSLVLKESKRIVLNGNKGLSQKSDETGNASYYYSYTRLKTTGTITIDNNKYKMEGFSWFDHEWSTSALGDLQSGWDWFSLQLSNNTEIMIYMLRLKDGTVDPVSSGTYVDKSGDTVHLKSSDFIVETVEFWKSPSTNIKYPSKWTVMIPKYNIELDVQPVINNQEFNHSFTYWEGAVRVSGDNISGQGYVELTGY